MNELTLENLIAVIRAQQGISVKEPITGHSDLEIDLGITGDDGIELLEEIEKHFAVSFSGPDGGLRDIFGLAPNEYLFHSEGCLNLNSLFQALWRRDIGTVKSISVGQLYAATQRAKHNAGKD